jgi:aromatic ring hydroxylase
MLMSSSDYRESLRRFRPTVFVNGRRIDSVADDAALAPGINAIGLTYDFARDREHAPLMLATQASSGRTVNRLLHINATTTDLLYKLEAVRLCAGTAAAPSATSPTTPSTPSGRRPIASTPMWAPTTTRASSPTCIKCKTPT